MVSKQSGFYLNIVLLIRYLKMKKHTKDLYYILIIALLVILASYKILLSPDQVLYSDSSDYINGFLSYKYLIKDSIDAHGEVPLWNPFLLSNGAFAADPQTFMFYPINLLYFFINTHLVTSFSVIFHLILLGVSMYFFMRVLKVSRFSAFVSAIIITFSGKLMSSLFVSGHTTFLNFAWTPLIFALFELAIQKKNIHYSILAGIAMAFQLMGLHSQIFIYTLFCFFLYFIFRLFTAKHDDKRKARFKTSIYFLVLIISFILVYSVQLFSTFELYTLTERQGGTPWEFASSYSLPPKQLISFIFPHIFGTPVEHTYWGAENFWELTGYIGVIALLLSFFALTLKRNKFVYFFAGLAIFSILFSLGKYFPLYYFFYKFIPLINMFRIPSRMLFMYSFSIAVLSGMGINSLMDAIKKNKNKDFLKKILRILLILSIIGIVTFSFVLIFKENILSHGQDLVLKYYESGALPNVGDYSRSLDYYLENVTTVFNSIFNDAIIIIVSFVSFSILLLLLTLRKIKPKFFSIALIILILIELWSFAIPAIQMKGSEELFDKSDIIRFLENDKTNYRVLDIFDWKIAHASISENIGNKNNIYQINKIIPLAQKDYKELIFPLSYEVKSFDQIQENRLLLLNLLNTKYFLTRTPINHNDFKLIYDKSQAIDFKSGSNTYLKNVETLYIYENKAAFPRAFIVPNALLIKDKKERINIINSSSFDAKKYVIIEEDLDVPLNNKGEFKEATITYYSPNKIIVEINMDHQGFLVLSEMWYPDWNAYENGNKLELLKVNQLFRGVYLTEGKHMIKFKFEPVSITLGLIVSLLAILSYSLYLLILLFKSNKKH